jgi:hypothetical protein
MPARPVASRPGEMFQFELELEIGRPAGRRIGAMYERRLGARVISNQTGRR